MLPGVVPIITCENGSECAFNSPMSGDAVIHEDEAPHPRVR